MPFNKIDGKRLNHDKGGLMRRGVYQSQNSNTFSIARSNASPRYCRGGRTRHVIKHSESNGNGDNAPTMEPALRVLSFFEHGPNLAFACYNEDANEIIYEDAIAHNRMESELIIQGVLMETKPNLILVGSLTVANQPLLDCLTTMPVEELYLGEQQEQQPRKNQTVSIAASDNASQQSNINLLNANIPYKLLKSSAFEPRACRAVILQKLRVLSLMHRFNSACSDPPQDHFQPGTYTQSSLNYHALASVINFDSLTLIRALGSLLTYLRTTAFRLEEGSTVTVNSIRHCPASSSFLRLDDLTLKTLRIFATDFHPLVANNNIKGRSHQKSKEGFSIFTLLDRTKSKAGRERLRQWMMQPLRDVSKIKSRHVGIELFLHPICHSSALLLLERLSVVKSMDAILLRMQRCCAQPSDFLAMGRMLEAAYAIISILGGELREKAHELDVESRSKYFNMNDGTITSAFDQAYTSVTYIDELLQRCHSSVILQLRLRMSSVIDEEVTEVTKDHVVIHYGFHEELDRAKETFETLDETLSEVGRQVLAKHEELISLKVVFLPQVGFMISIDKRQHVYDDATNTFPNIPEDFDFVFVQENDAFFKNPDMNQLDEEIGDLDAFIKDTEALIVSDLEEEILECETELRSTFSALADLDCILSLGGCAADLNYIKPEITPAEEEIIDIVNGRHPLQELIVNDEFIPNDTAMDNENRVLIITGPNFSGKSCYARQIGVLVYLAHIGSFLPCDRAKIAVMDQILVSFSEVETCSVPQSTFQRDLTHMASIMHRCTPSTLVIIDEFGKGDPFPTKNYAGTAPASGIAVLTSALQRLVQLRCKVVCTTHFLEMFSFGLLIDRQEGIKAVQMSIHVPETIDDDAIPLFKLEDGIAKSSAGLICARMAGLKKKIVDRASEIISALKEGRQVQPLDESRNANSAFHPNVTSAIRLFLAVDSWATASDEDLDLLQELVSRI